MTAFQDNILERVLGTLSEDEVSNSIAYLSLESSQAGERVRAGDVSMELPWDAHIVFVDLEPGVNWGHECCYLLIGADKEEVIRIAARMPPFLTGAPNSHRVIWQGPRAPDWAVETNPG